MYYSVPFGDGTLRRVRSSRDGNSTNAVFTLSEGYVADGWQVVSEPTYAVPAEEVGAEEEEERVGGASGSSAV